MKLTGPFIINDKVFSRNDLLSMAGDIVNSGREEKWRKDLFSFITDFLGESAALSQKTSGTTGKPRNLTLRRDAMVRSARMSLDYFRLLPGDSAMLCLPVDYIAGKMMVVRALVGGLKLLTIKPTGKPMELLDRPVDFSAMVPMQLFESLKNPGQIQLIKKLIVGGGEIGPGFRKAIREIEGTEIYETFGMSETYTHFAVRRINGPGPEVNFRILEGAKVGADSRGCATVDIPGITEGKVVTNDLIEMKDHNSFEWLGRIDNVIDSGGIKIIPEVLEEKIRSIIGQELVITGISDDKLGKKIVLIVESDSKDLPIDEWKGLLRTKLKNYEVPRAIYAIPELPRNAAMKVLRKDVLGLLDN